ncbi:tRNA pseudouridine(38/39) synthase isoform X2 [Euwallacea fornicatus]|uniref:tRNA pseudouridine(38/39) synthase isoform X2 n=1 Tax=Euwallacea fornicatus TaxID=995702 RepID=UPI00338DCEB9
MDSKEHAVKIVKPNKFSSAEQLADFSKEELIAKIQSLEAHNIQLQNIINKSQNKSSLNSISNNFDFLKCRFRHILLHVFYLGWDYQGFAVQEDTTNTIEYHLFKALMKTCLIKNRESANYHRCGRTDKGVSSFGQVISIDVRSKLSNLTEKDLDNEIDYCKVLNRVLPSNIQCVAWAPSQSDFSARFNCISRTYKYYFPKGNLNIHKMREASKYLIGSHDFRNFAKMDVGNGVVQFVRNILEFQIQPWNLNRDIKDEFSLYVAIIKGNAFLWHQIRYIMSVLFLIGANKEEPSLVLKLLNVKENPRKPEYNMASEIPLNLFFCEYDEVTWKVSQESLRAVIQKLQQIWYFTTAKSSMIRDVISNLLGKLEVTTEITCLSECLISGAKSKKYIPIMKRKTCESLEDKIQHYSKRKRIKVVVKSSENNK